MPHRLRRGVYRASAGVVQEDAVELCSHQGPVGIVTYGQANTGGTRQMVATALSPTGGDQRTTTCSRT
jgi:hypothetical protein